MGVCLIRLFWPWGYCAPWGRGVPRPSTSLCTEIWPITSFCTTSPRERTSGRVNLSLLQFTLIAKLWLFYNSIWIKSTFDSKSKYNNPLFFLKFKNFNIMNMAVLLITVGTVKLMWHIYTAIGEKKKLIFKWHAFSYRTDFKNSIMIMLVVAVPYKKLIFWSYIFT